MEGWNKKYCEVEFGLMVTHETILATTMQYAIKSSIPPKKTPRDYLTTPVAVTRVA